ncbi:DUF456 domain-containing protein [Aquibacillus rhizosphaerae]|uniref:DUF456 domain-containing protein n=1 Tax=Aquibacillus rhizosphaerae TaxID=3051431 RepID=A0ABT7L5G0_9BACI|nr:DUF456 domain-containing protein [Aquibacillus sp. LR5S19]MDL4841106.1 DUF456 domain-containing protein [Aquibacillus sp. LR5S19]
MDLLMWLLITVCFVLSFVGVIFPLVPSPLVLWVGFLLYFFFINGDNLSWVFWTAMAFLTIVLIVADIIANSYFVKKYGGSKWGERTAAIAVIVGSFVFPPFGIIAIPFIAVLVVELVQQRSTEQSFQAAIGSLLGFLGGAFAKVFIQVVMIVWFFISVWW